MTHLSKYLFSILLVTVGLSSLAQKVTVDAKCNNEFPALGENVQITYSFSSSQQIPNDLSLEAPNFGSLKVLQQGNAGTSNSIKIINGVREQTSTLKFAFILQPTKKEKVTIGELSFVSGGKKYKSKTFEINVGAKDPKAKIVPKNVNLLGRISVSKSNLILGEHALVTHKLYSKVRGISGGEQEFPTTKGLWTEALPANNDSATQETIAGVVYDVHIIKREIVFPQTTGEIKISPFSIEISYGGGYSMRTRRFEPYKKETIKSNSPTINVSALPKGAPNSFQNLVGKNVKMDYSYSVNSLEAGQPLEIKIKISGQGNMRQLEQPNLLLPSDFDAFDPEEKESIKLTTSGLSGYKEFSFLVIPQYHGVYEIAPFEYSYYDLESKSYQTISRPAQTINVSKSANSIAKSENGGVIEKKNVKVLNTEIRHITLQTTLVKKGTAFFGSTWFWTGLTAPFGLLLALLLFTKKAPKEKNETEINRKKAGKKSFKALASAQNKLSQNDSVGFYSELYNGVLTYLSDKFQVPTASLSKESISTTLQTNGVDTDTQNSIVEIIESCEMARFAPVSQSGAEQTMLLAKNTIQKIEKDAK
ncbi:MAG: hypothetical protein ACI8Q1_000348 [Parvicella sp.]|jgi:hypothetical protein